jgi:hypothetical protein
VGSATFADGTTFATVIDDAQRAIDGIDGVDGARLGYVARLSVLRRLRHDRDELSDMSIAIAADDGQRDLDLFDDPTHDILAPAIDAVLAAIEALRAHLVPRPAEALEDLMEEHEAHRTEDRTDLIPMPSAWSTPFGNIEVHQEWLAYEPSWTSAREAARHARRAQRVRHDDDAESAERSWQAERLSQLLER